MNSGAQLIHTANSVSILHQRLYVIFILDAKTYFQHIVFLIECQALKSGEG